MTLQLVYRPQVKQESWHECPAYESGFGGAKFGGKSLALLMESIRYSHHPLYRGIIFRRTYPRLSELVDRARQWFLPMGARWDGDGHRWVFESGASVAMRHCQHEEDKYNYQGHEYQFMGFDQLEEFTESQYTFLLAQNRSGVGELQAYTRSTFNPGGIGHAWVKKRFIEHGSRECTPWVEKNEEGVPLPSRCFHFANIDDNPKGEEADPTYRQRLQNLALDDRRALLHGDWDIFAGQYFTEWRRDRHVIAPFTPPEHWRRWGGLDWGYAAPLSFGLYTQDPDSMRIYRIRELYQTRLRDGEAIERIWAIIGGDRIDAIYADPSMWQKRSNDDALSTAETYIGKGRLPLQPANNDRLNGWRRLRNLLADGPDGTPMFQVTANCREFIRTLPGLVHDQAKPEDVDTDGEDHCGDECRYALLARATERGRQGFVAGRIEVVSRGQWNGRRTIG